MTAIDWLIDCIFVVPPVLEYFTNIGTSLLPTKNCKVYAFARLLQPLKDPYLWPQDFIHPYLWPQDFILNINNKFKNIPTFG